MPELPFKGRRLHQRWPAACESGVRMNAMAHYEIDLPHEQASRFDDVLSRYLSDELASRDGVDVRVTAYSPRVGG